MEADVLFETERAAREADLRSTTDGSSLLSAHLSALQAAYPDFYTANGCRSRRLQPLEAAPADAEAAGAAPEAFARQLKLTGCTPQSSASDSSYKAAFWAQTEENFCTDVPGTNGAAACYREVYVTTTVRYRERKLK